MTKKDIELFLIEKQGYLKKAPIETAKAIWKKSSKYTLPKTHSELEKELNLIGTVQRAFRAAKTLQKEVKTSELIDLYTEIIQEKNKPKRRLFFDIEITPNLVVAFQIGPKVNLSIDNIVEERKVICICYKWSDDSKIYSLVWKDGNDKEVLEKFSKVLESADEIVGHNSDNFDIKHVRARCLYHDIKFPIKLNSIDTLKMARQGYKFNSNKLDYIARFLGIGKKTDTGGLQLWKDIFLYNSKDALNKMVEYCKNDVDILEKVYICLQDYSPKKKFKYELK